VLLLLVRVDLIRELRQCQDEASDGDGIGEPRGTRVLAGVPRSRVQGDLNVHFERGLPQFSRELRRRRPRRNGHRLTAQRSSLSAAGSW
jgi:hypothetical protein